MRQRGGGLIVPPEGHARGVCLRGGGDFAEHLDRAHALRNAGLADGFFRGVDIEQGDVLLAHAGAVVVPHGLSQARGGEHERRGEEHGQKNARSEGKIALLLPAQAAQRHARHGEAGAFSRRLFGVAHHFAVHQGKDAVGLLRDGQIVRDQDQRDAEFVPHLPQQRKHFAAGLGVQVAGGLVGKEYGGLVGQRAGDGNALLLAAGKRAGQVVHAVADFQHVDQMADVGLVRRALIEHHGQQDVLVTRQLAHQVVCLEHKAEPAAAQHRKLVVVVGEQVGTLDKVPCRAVGYSRRAQHVQKRGFARAARPR